MAWYGAGMKLSIPVLGARTADIEKKKTNQLQPLSNSQIQVPVLASRMNLRRTVIILFTNILMDIVDQNPDSSADLPPNH